MQYVAYILRQKGPLMIKKEENKFVCTGFENWEDISNNCFIKIYELEKNKLLFLLSEKQIIPAYIRQKTSKE